MRIFFSIIIILCNLTVQAQYAPQVGLPGSTAIHKSSSTIKSWATHCTVHRGYRNIAMPTQGWVSSGDSSLAIGPADGMVVSLGDSGMAILTFSQPIVNNQGFDFVIFENGFPHLSDPSLAYLELATVSVSSDGVNFYSFPAHSLTPTDQQIAGAGEYGSAHLVHNLAGKYIAPYGTPFDLQDLAGQPGLNIQSITHIKITDVVGAINSIHSTRDAQGNTINDPYPTDFAIGGFDLDAVGVLHPNNLYVKEFLSEDIYTIAPNPVSHTLIILGAQSGDQLVVWDALGKQIWKGLYGELNLLDIKLWHRGVYFIHLTNKTGSTWRGRMFKE